MLKDIRKENNKLIDIKKELEIITKSYDGLKKKAGDFLTLEKKYKKTQDKILRQEKHMKFLENNFDDKKNNLFLSGAGVFVAGIFLGIIFRKKKKSSFL